jgi:hypothetical protein
MALEQELATRLQKRIAEMDLGVLCVSPESLQVEKHLHEICYNQFLIMQVLAQ